MYELNKYYGEDYFGTRMNWKPATYKVLAETIEEVLEPQIIVDVGCGNGILMSGFKAPIVLGVEGSDAGVKASKERGFSTLKHDLRTPFVKKVPYADTADLVVSIEVAEHLEEEYADTFVDTLCSLSDTVVLTASNDAGYSHFNCQPKKYWIDKFRARGYDIALQEQTDVYNKLKERINPRYGYLYNNMMVFKK